jgi:hypothetical protein
MILKGPFGTTLIVPAMTYGRAVASWLRHYATSLKVAGSIPYEAIEYFQFT